MNPNTSKNYLHRTAAAFLIMIMLIAAWPVQSAGAVSLNITSAATGTWEATAWPSIQRSGTITVTAGNAQVVGTGTAFLTELSKGNILRTTANIMIGTVSDITSDTTLTLTNLPATTRTNIAYNVQGVGPADNVTIAAGHNVTIAANPVNQTGSVKVNSGGTLTVSDPGTIFSTLTVDGAVNATTGNEFGELIINNGGVVTAGTNGAYTALSLTINSGGTMNVLRDFTVDSAALIAGTINFNSTSNASRAMRFLGPVTLNNGATWNESTTGNGSNNTYSFFSNFTNNAGVFTTSSIATHSFAGTGKTISGSTNTSIARVNVAGTYTNSGTFTVGTILYGTGALTNSAAGIFNLGGESSISVFANAGTFTKTGPGPISTALANFTNTGTMNLNGTGTIVGITNNTGGTVNLFSSGLINSFNNATATSTLNIFDITPVPHFTTLTVSAPGNTVDYSGDGPQTVKPIVYSNLIFSGSGDKSITMPNGSTLTTGNLSIAPTGTAKANITGPNLVVNSLSLGGFGRASGTWGSTTSAAVHTDDDFFAPATGYLNVTTDTRLSQTVSFTSTAPTDAVVGGDTYTPTATATSGLPVTFTIDASASSVCSISAGVVSFDAPGTCVINANQSGNDNYKPAPQAQQSFVVHTEATVHVSVAGTEMIDSPFTLLSGQSTRKSFVGINNGPVKVLSNQEIVAGERLIYKVNNVATSFSEMMGMPDSQLDTVYWLPWYNNKDLDTQLRFANVSGATASVHVYIGGVEMTGSPFTVLSGESTRKSFFGINNGPVQIVSDQQIVAAERVIYKVNNVNTSFTEMMALPNSQLDTVYWLPWYNNKDLDTQLRFANVSGATATVHVYIGGVEMTGSPFTLLAGESTRKSFFGVNNGPVQIVSDQQIVAAERVIYKVNNVNTSFSEMMALPNSQLDTVYWLPWYNNKDLDTQLRFANVSGATATVHVYIGGVEMTGSPFTLLAGESTRKSFFGVNNGPVQIVSDQQIVAAERVIYKVNNVNTSFTEMMALPHNQLDTTYWFPWYNNKDLDTQLRFGYP